MKKAKPVIAALRASMISVLLIGCIGLCGCSLLPSSCVGGSEKKTDDEEEELTIEDKAAVDEDALFASSGIAAAEKIGGEDAEACLTAAKDFLDRYRAEDPAAAQCLVGYDDGDELSYSGVQGILAEKLSYELGDVYSCGDGYYVEAVLRNVDFGAVYDSTAAQATEDMSSNDVVDLFRENLESTKPAKTFDVKIYLWPEPTAVQADSEETEGSGASEKPETGSSSEETAEEESGTVYVLKVSVTSDLSNALLGGANEYLSNLVDEQISDLQE